MVSMDPASWTRRQRAMAGGLIAAILVGVTAWAGYRGGWWGCARANDQAKALRAYQVESVFALAPPDALLVRESTLTGPCVPRLPPTKESQPYPEFATAVREYDTPRQYSKDELMALFDGAAQATGWRVVRGDETADTANIVYCKTLDETVTRLVVSSSTSAVYTVSIEGHPNTSTC